MLNRSLQWRTRLHHHPGLLTGFWTHIVHTDRHTHPQSDRYSCYRNSRLEINSPEIPILCLFAPMLFFPRTVRKSTCVLFDITLHFYSSTAVDALLSTTPRLNSSATLLSVSESVFFSLLMVP